MAEKKIADDVRQQLVHKHPFFVLLSPEEVKKLASLMREEYRNENDVITNEYDIVDKIYFIAEGEAKASRSYSRVDRKTSMHVAYLKKGDIIGLTKVGLFSTSGLRTAKITAITPMTLLAVNMMDLYPLTTNYPTIKKNTEKFILLKFLKDIKELQLTNQQISALANKIPKVFLPKNVDIFTANAPAKKGYILLNGQVQLTKLNHTSLVAQGDFIGKEVLDKNSVYQETATTLIDCELFEISEHVISGKNAGLSLLGRLLKMLTPRQNG